MYGDVHKRLRRDPNRMWTEGGYSFIELYNNDSEPIAVTIIDSDKLDEVKNHKWCRTQTGYVQTTLKNRGKPVFLHRYLTGSAGMVDHINRDPLDNRLENLRIVDYSVQNRNRNLNSKSGVKGVWFNGLKYYVRLWNGSTNVSFGSFDDIDEAAHVYQTAYEQLHLNHN